MSTYTGTLSEKRDLASYDNDGNKVINLIVKTSKKLVGAITVPVKRTIVLFRGEAIKADTELKLGDHVVFTEVIRNPRIYKTAKGNAVEVVDMVAESFQVIKAKDFKENLDSLMEMNLSDEKLTFSDDDRIACEEASVASDATGTEDSEIPFG